MPLTRDDGKELLEIIEERYDRKVTIVTSQLPIKAWHDAMQNKAVAETRSSTDWCTTPIDRLTPGMRGSVQHG